MNIRRNSFRSGDFKEYVSYVSTFKTKLWNCKTYCGEVAYKLETGMLTFALNIVIYSHRLYFTGQFQEYKVRHECPVDCEIISYSSSISYASFIQYPPTGIEPRMINQQKEYKNFTLHQEFVKMSEEKNNEELESYIE